MKPVKRILRPLVPIAIHYLLSQMIIGMINWYLNYKGIRSDSVYNRMMLFAYIPLTVLGGLLFFYMYRQDAAGRRRRRIIPEKRYRLKVLDVCWLTVMGAGLCLHLNQFMGIVIRFLGPDRYEEQTQALMNGHSFVMIVLIAGMLTPLLEETLFRWLVYLRLEDEQLPAVLLSGILFGIYHGNPMQGLYAALLGIGMAWMMKSTGSLWASYFVHMGANVFALVWPQMEAFLWDHLHVRYMAVIIPVEVLSAVCVGAGVIYYTVQMKKRGFRAI